MKGVIIAGGNGTRLRPLTLVTNKQLLPIYDKPMVLYPLKTLTDMGVTDIMLISNGESIGTFMQFLGDGSDYGANLTYRVQKVAGGIAQAVGLAKDFVGDEQFVVILGDNIYGSSPIPPKGCGIVVKKVTDPNRFGVLVREGATADEPLKNKLRIIEKPKEFVSDEAVTGLYFYTPDVFGFIETMKPSARGEMEITDVNNYCLENNPTEIILFEDFWADAGTPDALLGISNIIYEKRKAQ